MRETVGSSHRPRNLKRNHNKNFDIVVGQRCNLGWRCVILFTEKKYGADHEFFVFAQVCVFNQKLSYQCKIAMCPAQTIAMGLFLMLRPDIIQSYNIGCYYRYDSMSITQIVRGQPRSYTNKNIDSSLGIAFSTRGKGIRRPGALLISPLPPFPLRHIYILAVPARYLATSIKGRGEAATQNRALGCKQNSFRPQYCAQPNETPNPKLSNTPYQYISYYFMYELI